MCALLQAGDRKQKHNLFLLFIYYYLFSGIQLDQPNLLKVDRSHDSISPCWWYYWYCGQKCLGSYSLCWQRNSLLVKTGHCGCESGSGHATVLVLGVEKSPSTKVHWVTDPPFFKYTSDCLWNGLCKFWSWKDENVFSSVNSSLVLGLSVVVGCSSLLSHVKDQF